MSAIMRSAWLVVGIGALGALCGSTSPHMGSARVITMVTSGGAVKAQPQGLSNDGSSFQMQWVSSGP